MKTKLLKGTGFVGVLLALGLVYISNSKAQPTGHGQVASSVTTNWVGCLVVGKNDTVDSMAVGRHPTIVQQIDIGLRSDGVVIWQQAAK